MNFRKSLFSAVLSVSFAGVSSGIIVSIDDPVFGSGALTRDTAQGLDFLDLTLSRSSDYGTYLDIQAQLNPSGVFEGFRLATEVEVIALINNYGFSPTVDDTPLLGSGPTTFGNVGRDQLSGLVDLLGVSGTGIVSGTNSTLRFSAGLTSTLVQAPWTAYDVRVVGINDLDDPNSDDWVTRGGGSFNDLSEPWLGAFLVRESSSPVSSSGTTALMFGIGLLGLGVIRRRLSN